jgi:hypothetical protein
MFEASARGGCEGSLRVVGHFLDRHLSEARRSGWTDSELFGCHPDPAFATVRYDSMGAVTIAALTRSPTASVLSREIRFSNGLATRRPLPCDRAKPVWTVFRPLADERR